MFDQPTFSIIVPTLNELDSLEPCMTSVLDQDGPAAELIVMDGGSADGTLELLKRYSDRIAHWRSYPDAGPAAAINEAVAAAQGQFVLILHAHDILLPGALVELARHTADDESGWWFGQCTPLNQRDEPMETDVVDAPESLSSFLTEHHAPLPISGSLFLRPLLRIEGGMDPSLRFAYGDALAAKLLAKGLVPKALGMTLTARRSPLTERSSGEVMQMGREWLTFARQIADRVPMNQRFLVWKHLDERQRIYTIADAQMNESRESRRLWTEALRHPWWLADAAYRHALGHGLAESAEQQDTATQRKAA